MSAELNRRVTVTLRTLTIVSLAATGIALAMTLKGHPTPALVAIIVILFVQIYSLETLRAFTVLQSKEPRR